jgi:stringent starvation protein B
MTSNRPYLIRALFEWIVDNNCTPYLIVSTRFPGVQVPEAHVDNDRIVLNVSPQAVRNLELGNERIAFDGRFGGKPFRVETPVRAVMAIYAKETGQGTAFDVDDSTPPDQPPDNAGPGGHLRVVK